MKQPLLLPITLPKYSPLTQLSRTWLALRLCVLNLALLGWVGAQAQGAGASQNLLPPKFIPKSPTISAFPRFDAQQLVNLPTGAAQLAVPLAEVNCGSLHLPVSLAYSYTGLKVGQPYDLVGLGWALQAGVSITRQVNGLVDDNYASDPLRRYSPAQLYTGVNDPAFLKRALEQDVDTGPDLYSFSLPNGLSGRFIFVDTTLMLLPQQPVHIRRAGLGFQVTTEDGVRYQFQAVETTTPHPDNFGPNAQHASAWHLTRLISADNTDTLRLYYTAHNERLPQQCSVTTGRYFTGNFVPFGNVVTPDPSGPCGSTADYPFHNVQMLPGHVQTQYLDSIKTRGTCLTFAYLTVSRGSSFFGYELQRVRLIATTGGRREIKRVTLYQHHFGDANPPIVTDYRLRLDSLQESANGSVLPTYRFRYTDGNFPLRGSAAIDYWGYANGATSNGNYQTPDINPTLLADPELRAAGITPADREPSFEAAVAGALAQVTYPTGGTTRWEYEPGRIRQDSVGRNLNGSAGSIPADTLSVDVQTWYNPADTVHIHGGPKFYTPSPKTTFQVTEAGIVRLLLERQPYDRYHNYGQSNTYRDFNIWRRLPSGDTLITNLSDIGYPTAYRVRDPDSVRRFTFYLVPGTYVAQVYCERLEAHSSINIRVPYHASANLSLGILGPGVRVARTTTTAPDSPALVHTYQYAIGNFSSGLSLLPQNGKGFDTYINRVNSVIGGQGVAAGVSCEFVNTSSDNRSLGSEFNKYDFYYACVGETERADQGTTLHYFTHQPQQFNDIVPTSVEVYRQATSATRQLVQRTLYTYESDSSAVYPLLRVRSLVSNIGTSIGGMDSYAPTPYEVRASFTPTVSTTQVRYDAQGDSLLTVTISTYERQRLRQTATRTSTGWEIERYKRLSDYASLPAVTALRVNSFNPVIETQNWRRSLTSPDLLLVAGHLTLYDPTWRSPASRYQLRIDRPQVGLNQAGQLNGRYTSWFSDTHYEQADSVRYAVGSGDLIQHQPTHGRPTSYLLGYDRTLVIAEAKNAAFAQLAYTSFEPLATGRWAYDSTGTHRVLGGRTGRWAYQLDGAANITRGQLPAGDYELTYWTQGTSSLSVMVQGGSLLSGGPQLIATTPTNWYQYRTRLHCSALGQISLNIVSGAPAARLDEVRLYPVGAQLTSYTHDPLVGITSQTDPTGRLVTYEYDALGRLVRTRDEQSRILSQQQYHYAQH